MRKLLVVIAVSVGLVCFGSLSAKSYALGADGWQGFPPTVQPDPIGEFPDTSVSHNYYVPYFSNENGIMCGLALANYGNETNVVELEYYSSSGSRFGSEEKTLIAFNQTAFVPSLQESATGWIKIKAPYPLCGLTLVFNDTSMLDLDFKESLHTKFIIPQVAANGTTWDSILMMCNPNDSGTTVTLTYFPPTALDVYEELNGTITKIMSTTEYNEDPTGSGNASSGVGPLVVFSTGHGLKEGQRITIYMSIGITPLDHSVFTVTVLDENHFTLNGTAPINGFPFESEGSWTTRREDPAPREDPTQKSLTIPKNGSTIIDLREVFNKPLNGGYLHISSLESIAAFMTYDGSISGENNWKAGLSAVPVTGGELSDRGIGGEEINGTYDGIKNQGNPFYVESTDTTVSIEGHSISITLDSFFSGEWRLTGIIASDYSSAQGTYQCSDFTSGEWSSQNLNLLRPGVLYGEIMLGGKEIVTFGFK